MHVFIQTVAIVLLRLAVLAAAFIVVTLATRFTYMAQELSKAAIVGAGGGHHSLRERCEAIPQCAIRDITIRLEEPREGRSLDRWTSFVTYIQARVAPDSKKAYIAAAKSAYPVALNIRGEIGDHP